MQAKLVVVALLLYAMYASNPIAEIRIFSKTLNMSPGDLFTVLFVLGSIIKALVQAPNENPVLKPPAVRRFLVMYIFLAVVFLIPTLLFFLTHNELVSYFGRSLFNYLLWIIALVLFYYSLESQLQIKDLRLISWLLMGTFFLGVMSNLLAVAPGFDLFKVITDTLKSDQTRLAGQVGDPNQLGALAAFLSTLGIMGVLYERYIGAKLAFLLLTAGTGLVLLLTQSRESMVTLFIAVLCIVVYLLRSQRYGRAFVVLLSILLSSALVLTSVPRVVETLTAMAVGDTTYTLSDRGQVWRTVLQIISTQPLGIGMETMYLISNNTVEQAHNTFLQATLQAGYVGLFVFLGFIVCLIQLLREQIKLAADNWVLDAYFAFLIGYLVTSLSSDHFISFYTFNAIFFGFLGFVVQAH